MKLTLISFFALLLMVACNTESSDDTATYMAQLEAENKSLKKEVELLKTELLLNEQKAENIDIENSELVEKRPIEFTTEELKQFDSLFL